jgi:hypothetical protein
MSSPVKGIMTSCKSKSVPQLIYPSPSPIGERVSRGFWSGSHLSTGNSHLDLAARRGDELVELLANTPEEAEAVVLGEGLEEGLDRGAAAAGVLDQFADDGRLVLRAQHRGGQDLGQLGVLDDDGVEGGDGLGGGVEAGGLDGGGVLQQREGSALLGTVFSFSAGGLLVREMVISIV